MIRRRYLVLAMAPLFAAGCATAPESGTLASLRTVEPDVAEVEVADTLDLAMQSYRRYLAETPTSALTPEAMRRLADLQLEKEFGITGAAPTRRYTEMAAPESAGGPSEIGAATAAAPVPTTIADAIAAAESDDEFERRTTGEAEFEPAAFDVTGSAGVSEGGPLEAIKIYERLLTEYPNYERRDQVLYQMARAYDELGRTEEAMDVMQRLVGEFGYSRYSDEVQFRRGEYYFTRRRFREAEAAYEQIVATSARSDFYELALYKLGWSLYKQDFYEEALHRYMALLDYKVSIGYDFDQAHAEEDERRVADTFRVISLSFSNLGGPDTLAEYYGTYGNRAYEDRIYQNLAEFYFDKMRYADAAAVYDSFVDRYPFHRVSPDFSMRVIGIYEGGDFPKLVVESKKSFATKYGLQSEYWQHFDAASRPEVLGYLKTNLEDLANHYHALYQEPALAEEKPANYAEALVWYRAFLASFPTEQESPGINYQLADLLLENDDFGEAAREYERTAYSYAAHDRAAAAGYAAIFAHREQLKGAGAELETELKRATVESSLKFADTFPDHEHAAVVLGAAAEDLYALEDYAPAATAARTLIERYPNAELPLRRTAWTVAAHSAFELHDYAVAEPAYAQVLELTPPGDPAEDHERQALVDNLAASIYKQGEQANEAQDYRAAAGHFLRITQRAPTSSIRPSAEYDAAAALMKLQDWTAAAAVLDGFRAAFPDHELNQEATKQLAFVYREGGETSLAAGEYERVAAEAADPELQREALLSAGELYEQAKNVDSALGVYERYVAEFQQPVEVAIEIRSKVAEMYRVRGDDARYRDQLAALVAADAAAGGERTDRTRYLAAQAGLVLAEPRYAAFNAVELVQPFQQNLARKRALMDEALKAYEDLVSYEVADVTTAATFHMAEIYASFSRSLLDSERPTELNAAELAEYEDVLEEQAFPFEERAIEVHEANIDVMIAAGVYNKWVEQSFARLATLMPGRYAKEEQSIGQLGAIETFTYRAPNAPEPVAAAVPAEPERRTRAPAAKGPTVRLEVLAGEGFTITDGGRVSPELRERYLAAVGLLEQGLYERGVAELEAVTAQAPELANPHVDLGIAYARTGRLVEAAASLEKAVALSASHPIAHEELALVYRKQARFGDARAQYEQALALYPDFHLANRNLAILCDLYQRDYGCALQHYQAYQTLVPEDAQVAIWIADLQGRAGQ
ncbi:MAG TPA: tetratricopeptide repeat protein [Gammaproteobacteria bacterium]|nr:tetratricopeptide repeat protein [Gammaproteobacteria bacterium]